MAEMYIGDKGSIAYPGGRRKNASDGWKGLS